MLNGSGTPWLAPPDLQAGPWDVSWQCVCQLSCVTVREDRGVWVQLRSCPGGRAQPSQADSLLFSCPAWSWESALCRGAFLGTTPSVSCCLPPSLPHADAAQPQLCPSSVQTQLAASMSASCECASHGF